MGALSKSLWRKKACDIRPCLERGSRILSTEPDRTTIWSVHHIMDIWSATNGLEHKNYGAARQIYPRDLILFPRPDGPHLADMFVITREGNGSTAPQRLTAQPA